ncbi:3D domain-containing protein [Muriicola marianensis]|uniref:Lipoprotein n=1 Tax=Muriicola marianensis TaxID=1324801 RepID=A0ABQ1QRP1_9FLAO|nr:3D domain-containing protein [Muriicola marianensis]GGD38885.1 lipoprotein [Muriicola marianensis]
MKYLRIKAILFLLFSSGFVSCSDNEDKWVWKTMEVTATAYNAIESQTNSLINIAAWGDTLKPGMKCIAVSRDLLKKGLKYDTPVRIEGFEGIYLVKDKMHSRWENRIDIFMGLDVQKAREWGRKKVIIQYGVKVVDSSRTNISVK